MRVLAALALLAMMVLPPVGHSAQAPLQEIVATVRDRDGALVSGLDAEDFILEVDGRPQTIVSLTAGPKNPVSIALVVERGPTTLFGIGGAIMERDAQIAAQRIFIRAATKSGDELMLIAFAGNQGYRVVEPLTQDPARIDSGLRSLYTWDINSLFGEVQGDFQGLREIARALAELKGARYRSRALVLATSVYAYWWNDSKFAAEVRASEIPLYFIAIPGYSTSFKTFSSDAATEAWLEGMPGLGERLIAEGRVAVTKSLGEPVAETGGRVITILPNLDENVVERLMAFASEVSIDLRGQYSLKFNGPSGESLGQVMRLRTKVPEHQVRWRRLAAN